MGERTIWEAARRPRFLLSWWPWRAVAYVLSTPVAAAAAVALLPWALVGGPVVARPVVSVERLRLRLVEGPVAAAGRRQHRPVEGPVAAAGRRQHPPVEGPVGSGAHRRPASWRDVAHLLAVPLAALPSLVLALVLVLVLALVLSPFFVTPHRTLALGVGEARTVAEALPYAAAGLVLLPVLLYVFALVAGTHAKVARALLYPSDALAEVSLSRHRLVTAFDAERRRIERDLHDGAQQRVVSLVLQLGIAKLEVPPDSPAAETLATAHAQAKQLLVELREFIHGIHPQVLSDLGLPAALEDLADRARIPITVSCDLPARPSPTVEVAAYFTAAEALSNAAVHSGATEIELRTSVRRNVLSIEITDNGRGGAHASGGTGLTGLADRAAALGGTLSLSSPPGGPTTVRAEFPC